MAFLNAPDSIRQYDIDSAASSSPATAWAASWPRAMPAVTTTWPASCCSTRGTPAPPASRCGAHPETRQDRIAAMGEDFGNSLAGTDAATLMREAEAHADDWDLAGAAAGLARKPLLVIGAQRGLAPAIAPLVAGIKAQPGAQVQSITLPSDHGFADHRIALAAATIGWLDAQRLLRERAEAGVRG
jgi:hypothetical protein